MTRIFNDFTRSAARVARALSCYETHIHAHLTGSVASRAGLRLSSGFGAAAVAGIALLISCYIYGLFCAECRFFKRHRNTQTDICAFLRCVCTSSSAAEAAAEKAFKNISHIKPVKSCAAEAAACCGRINPGMTEIIVSRTFFFIAQNLIRFPDFLKFSLSVFVVFI